MGMDGVAVPQRFKERFVGRPGKIRQASLGANEGGRGHG
jgi:hypothetical protein